MKKRMLSLLLAMTLCLGLAVPALAADDMYIVDGVLTECYSSGDVVIPDTVTRINSMAFMENKKMTSVVIPESVTQIGFQAFMYCTKLPDITIPSGVTELEDSICYACVSLTSVTLPAGLTKIGNYVFESCSKLPGLTIPDNVTSIGDGAFRNCKALASINIPIGVTSIGDQAFYNCNSLKDVYYAGSEEQWNAIAIGYGNEALTAAVHFGNQTPAAPSLPAAPTAIPTASTVTVNGAPAAFDAYNIGGANYFKLRDLAYVLNGSAKQFEVSWDAAANAISLTSGEPYTAVGGEMTAGTGGAQTTPAPTSSKILLNGAEIALEAYNIGGNNYFKLRDIGAAFDFGVDWDGANNTVVIDTSKGYTPD